MSDSLCFSLLGPLRVRRGPDELSLGPNHPRLVLALLLARSGQLVEISELIDLLWPSQVPPTAVNMMHRYIGMLRRVLEPDLPVRSGGRWLLRDVGGYRLSLAGARFDLVDFRRHVAEARRLAGQGDERAALDEFTAGLSLWQGRCAAGLGALADEHPDFVAIEREHLSAVADAAAVALRCDAPERVLPALRAAVAQSPLDETLQAQLLLALAASGNQSEAITRYDEVRSQLADELGVDPGAALQAAYLTILQREQRPETATAAPVRPAQLPSDLPVFAGRADLIDDGFALLSGGHSTVPILAFDGMPGVGKTTLAIHLAHRLAPCFTDGQLYADLRGFDPEGRVADPADVLHAFLGALGTAQEAIPAALDDRAALYRSMTAGRRLLIVLDNARDADQVRPLLPGTAPNAVLVTSRGRLGGLATAQGADLRNLDVLSDNEARACLIGRIGPARAAAEPQAVEQIIERSGRLPLALAVVAARAADADRSLGDIATDLRAGRDRLDAFSDDGLDRDVRAVFTWSYRLLSAGAARILELLPLFPGADITVEVAAGLAGTPPAATRSHFAELVRTGLLSRYRPRRYRLHDLVRAFADELGESRLSHADREQAWLRLENHYLHTTYAAVRLVRPGFADVDVPAVRADVVPLAFDDVHAAQAWFAEEYLTIRAVIARAAARPDAGPCWQLALLAKDLYGPAALWQEWATAAELAVEASTRAGDVTGMAQSHRSLAGARHYLGDSAATARHLKVAADLFEQSGDMFGRAEVLMNLGYVAGTEGDHTVAIAALREALAVFADRRAHQELNVLTILAPLYLATGDDRQSWDTAVAAAHMARERRDVHKLELAMSTISRVLSRRGHWVSALRMSQHHFEENLGRDDRHDAAMNLIEFGGILHDAGELDDAWHVWRRARAMSDDNVLDAFIASVLSPRTWASYRRLVEEG